MNPRLSLTLLSVASLLPASLLAALGSAPRLVSPAHQSSLPNNTPVLAWTQSGAEEVEVWLDGRLAATQSAGNNSFVPFPLAFGKHQWKVVAKAGKEVLASETGVFTVDDKPLAEVPSDALLLREGWRMASAHQIEADGAALSTGKISGDAWLPATLPSTVLTTLVRNGVYGDPYVHTNGLRIPDASDTFNKKHDLLKYSHIPGKNPWSKPYWYVRDFEVPAALAGKHLWLNLGEINYRAEVWLNGVQIGSELELVGMERRFRLDIDSAVKMGAVNKLAIAIYPVDSSGIPEGYATTPFGDPGNNMGEDGLISLNYAKWDTLGWDWIPSIADRDMGFAEDVFISGTQDIEIGDVYIAPQVTLGANPSADILAEIDLSNHSGKPAKGELVGRLSNAAGLVSEFRIPFEIAASGQTRIKLDPSQVPGLHLKNPKLWWPAELGEPALHTLTLVAQLANGGNTSKTETFGIRKVDTELHGEIRSFSINGRRLYMRGGNWVPDMLLNWNAARYEHEVEMALHSNLNFLRVWGPSGVPPKAFFEAADRKGLLVQQDFLHDHWGTKNNRNGYAPELKLFVEATSDIVRRLRNHPSIFTWCGGNEGPNPREDYIVQKILPTFDGAGQRYYLSASNGDGVQGGGPYHNMRPLEYFTSNKLKGFNSEVGPSGVPEFESLQRFLAAPPAEYAEDRFPVATDWTYHDATNIPSPSDNRKFTNYDNVVRDCYGAPEGTDLAAFKSYAARTQMVNYEAYRAAMESLNRSLWTGTYGFALWKSNSAWPSLLWQLQDWYLQTHAGFYATRRALAPLHVQMDRDTQILRVVNREEAPQKLRIEARLLSASTLGEVWSQKLEQEIPADASFALPVTVPVIKELSFLKLTATDSKGQVVSDNFYWLNREDDFRALALLPAPKLEVSATRSGAGPAIDVRIHNAGSTPALLVRARLASTATRQESAPSYWSDNYVFLLPGETSTIQVTTPAGIAPADPAILVSAYNQEPSLFPVTETGSKH